MAKPKDPDWLSRLLQAMREAGLNMKSLSRKAGLNSGYLSELRKKGFKPTLEAFLALAEAGGVSPTYLLEPSAQGILKLPVIGSVTTAELWAPIVNGPHEPFEANLQGYDLVAVEVRGDSMAPVYRDKDMLVCQRTAGKFAHNLIGLDCLIETTKGERYVKILERGTRQHHYNLRSYKPGVRDIENVMLDWVAPVVWIRRGGR